MDDELGSTADPDTQPERPQSLASIAAGGAAQEPADKATQLRQQ